MGSDDLFHRRKARTVSSLERQRQSRSQRERYLIVCEGTKTEPYYFNDLTKDFGILSTSVKIAPNDGCSPDRIVAHALKLYEDDARLGDSFDKVYCVFDCDEHSTFSNAVSRIKDLANTSKPFEAITSVPCFEYWLLLHFGGTAKPFAPVGGKSAGDQLVDALRKKTSFRGYAKANKGVYASLKDKLPVAINAAVRLASQSNSAEHRNPSTRIHVLIQALQALASPKVSIRA